MKVLICLSVLSLVTLHFSSSFGQTPKKSDRTAEWEYKILSNPYDEILNHHAKEGWEIATSAGGGGDNNSFFKVIMKRPKSHPLFGTQISELPKPEPPQPQGPKCRLTLAQSPVIRGLRLGMTSDELFAIFPANESEEFNRTQNLKKAELPPNFGYTFFNFSPSQYATKDRFIGIGSLGIGLFDRKVIYISADYYNTPEYDRMDQLMEVISRQFSLPEFKDWQSYKGNMGLSSISCDEFTVQVNGYSSNFNISISNPTYQKIVKDRRQADKIKKREGFKL